MSRLDKCITIRMMTSDGRSCMSRFSLPFFFSFSRDLVYMTLVYVCANAPANDVCNGMQYAINLLSNFSLRAMSILCGHLVKNNFIISNDPGLKDIIAIMEVQNRPVAKKTDIGPVGSMDVEVNTIYMPRKGLCEFWILLFHYSFLPGICAAHHKAESFSA